MIEWKRMSEMILKDIFKLKNEIFEESNVMRREWREFISRGRAWD
jgi:hypothetical protein